MKSKYLSVIILTAILMSGCSADVNDIKDKVLQKLPIGAESPEVVDVNEVVTFGTEDSEEISEEFSTVVSEGDDLSNLDISDSVVEEVQSEIQDTEKSEQIKKPKKTLADVYLMDIYVHPSTDDSAGFEGGYTDEYGNTVYTEGNSTNNNSSTEDENTSESETESSTEDENDTSWDAEMYKSLGIHAPKLDDWYPYKCSSITQKEDSFMYSEVGTDNMDKVVKIEFSKKELKISDEYKGASSLTEVLGSKCESSFDDGKNHGELIIKSDDIYCKITTDAIDRDEFTEIAKHYKSYL